MKPLYAEDFSLSLSARKPNRKRRTLRDKKRFYERKKIMVLIRIRPVLPLEDEIGRGNHL